MRIAHHFSRAQRRRDTLLAHHRVVTFFPRKVAADLNHHPPRTALLPCVSVCVSNPGCVPMRMRDYSRRDSGDDSRVGRLDLRCRSLAFYAWLILFVFGSAL